MTTSFTIMTWNLENLFKPGDEFGPKTDAIYQEKLTNLATTILSIAPDVVAVQEVGNPAAFTDLIAKLDGLYPHHQLSAHPDGRKIRVGLLSKFQLKLVQDFVNFPAKSILNAPDGQGGVISQMGRGALKATVTPVAGLDINIITTHLKSKLVTYPGNKFSPKDENQRAVGTGEALLKRTVEAVALRVFINQLVVGNNTPLILLGDLNDSPEAVTTQILQGPEDFSLSRADKSDDVRLYDLVQYISADRRYSRIYNKHREMIDHIMVSHELIFKRRLVDSFIEPIEGIGDNPNSRHDKVFSDHAPVYARFEL